MALVPPHGVRALVPVFAVQGGAARSTLTGLLAQVFGPAVRTVVLDTAARSCSPWPDWVGVGTKLGEKSGFPGLAAQPGTPDRAALLEAKARRAVTLRRGEAAVQLEPGEDPGYDVLADLRPWTRPPVDVPEDPRWYARVLTNGDWSVGIVDHSFPAAVAHIRARSESRQSLLDAWFQRQDAVPLLVGTSAAAGPSRLRRLTSILDTDGLPAERAAVAIVDVTGEDRPKWLNGELDALRQRVGTLVQIPFDKAIHNDELTYPDAVGGATLTAVRKLAEHIASAVKHQPNDGGEATYEDPYGRPDPRGEMAAYRAQVEAEHGPLPGSPSAQPSTTGPAATPAPSPAPTSPPTPWPAEPQPSTPPGQKSGGWTPGRAR